jgi:hypothetical protein
MADEKFKLPGSSYEEVVRIIKAYDHYESEVELNEVSQVSALHPTAISRNTGFLVAVGVLEGGQKKVLTSQGRSLARALDHEITDDIRTYWRDIVQANDFMRKLISAIRIRNGMDPATLQAHIAYSAGQPKTPKVMTGATTVIDILQVAEVVREMDGKLQAIASDSGTPPKDTARDTTPPPPLSSDSPGEQPLGSGSDRRGISSPQAVSLTIQIQVQCTPAELDELAPKLQALIAGLAPSAAVTRTSSATE